MLLETAVTRLMSKSCQAVDIIAQCYPSLGSIAIARAESISRGIIKVVQDSNDYHFTNCSLVEHQLATIHGHSHYIHIQGTSYLWLVSLKTITLKNMNNVG